MSNRVALVCSVRNEGGAIDALLDSIAAQTRPPDEIVIVDGGSRDGTIAAIRSRIAKGTPIQLVELPGSNISAARNAGIRSARAPIIAVTDCGVTLEPRWLEEITRPFERQTPPDVVAGFFAPAPQGAFETALGATTLPMVEEVDPRAFLPSSRSVAFRRGAWEAVGGYPEWLEHSEDIVFDLALKQRGFRFIFAPAALVHFRPRSSPRAFFKQYYLYARGDGRANLWPRRHAIRYLTYIVGSLVAFAGLRRHGLLLALVPPAALYVARPYQRMVPWLGTLAFGDQLRAIGWVPLIRVIGDVAKMTGYPVGWMWRLRR